jgi:hypothetical protein
MERGPRKWERRLGCKRRSRRGAIPKHPMAAPQFPPSPHLRRRSGRSFSSRSYLSLVRSNRLNSGNGCKSRESGLAAVGLSGPFPGFAAAPASKWFANRAPLGAPTSPAAARPPIACFSALSCTGRPAWCAPFSHPRGFILSDVGNAGCESRASFPRDLGGPPSTLRRPASFARSAPARQELVPVRLDAFRC